MRGQFEGIFEGTGKTIDDAEFGWLLQSPQDHQSGIHPEGWNDDWKEWLDNNPNASPKDVQKQLGDMMDPDGSYGKKYSQYLDKGGPAGVSHKRWKEMPHSERMKLWRSSRKIMKNADRLSRLKMGGKVLGKYFAVLAIAGGVAAAHDARLNGEDPAKAYIMAATVAGDFEDAGEAAQRKFFEETGDIASDAFEVMGGGELKTLLQDDTSRTGVSDGGVGSDVQNRQDIIRQHGGRRQETREDYKDLYY